jgi:Predicted ATPase with chaperone activity
LGELALDGRLRPARGAVCFAIACREKGIKEIILPEENAAEAALIGGVRAIGVKTLAQAVGYLEGSISVAPAIARTEAAGNSGSGGLFDMIAGQESAKRALEIVAGGGHNLSMWGPPGTGKTLLAKTLPEIIPPLSFEESLEVTKIYSVCGLLAGGSLIAQRPSARRTTPLPSRPDRRRQSAAAGRNHSGAPRRAVLDEFPEFHRDALEALRQPIEEGAINVLRARHAMSLPARFMLVLASNPCPCGNFGNPEKPCVCSPSQIRMYRKKLSGPLMDRIDLFINVPAVKYEKLVQNTPHESLGEKMRERVAQCRAVQAARYGKERTNAEMGIAQIKEFCRLDDDSEQLLKAAVNSAKISARGYHRVLKVSRTIADLDGKKDIAQNHVSEALSYRPPELI